MNDELLWVDEVQRRLGIGCWLVDNIRLYRGRKPALHILIALNVVKNRAFVMITPQLIRCRKDAPVILCRLLDISR